MPEQLPSPDVFNGPKEGPKEQSDRVLYADFEASLNELKFDQKEFEDAMFKALQGSGSTSFTVLKYYIGGPAAVEGVKSITRPDFDFFLESHHDSDSRRTFDKGVKSLSDDFKFQQKRFSAYTEILKGGRMANERVRVAGRGKMEIKTREEALRDSGMEAKVRTLAAGVGKPVADVTFEDAFDNKFYNSYLQPSMLGVAEYGLTWLEYRSKSERVIMDQAMSGYRKKVGEESAVGVVDEPKIEPKLEQKYDQMPVEGAEVPVEDLELVSVVNERYELLVKQLSDKPGVTLKVDKAEGKQSSGIGIYRDGKLVIAIEFGKDKDDQVVAVVRDPDVTNRDIEHVSGQKDGFSTLGSFVVYKLDHPGLNSKQLGEAFVRSSREVSNDSSKVEVVSEAEAKERGDIVLNVETGSWEPKPGMEFVDKNRERGNFAVQYRPEYRETVSKAEPQLRAMLADKLADYNKLAVGEVQLSAVETDEYGHSVVRVNYQGQEILKIEIRVYLAVNRPSYRLSVGGKSVDLKGLKSVGERVENILKKRVQVDEHKREEAEMAEAKAEAMKSVDVRLMPKPYEQSTNGFVSMTTDVFGEILPSGSMSGSVGRQAYLAGDGATYKVEIDRVRVGEGDYKLQYKLFVGTKREQVFDSKVAFKELYQVGRRGDYAKSNFASEMRNKLNDVSQQYFKENVPVDEYVSSVEEARKELKLDKK